jgi:hypothetical protein
MGGKFHLRLNNGKRPIANKYREGKMKSTLKRELKAREIVKRETIEASRAECVQRYLRSSAVMRASNSASSGMRKWTAVYSCLVGQSRFGLPEKDLGKVDIHFGVCLYRPS